MAQDLTRHVARELLLAGAAAATRLQLVERVRKTHSREVPAIADGLRLPRTRQGVGHELPRDRQGRGVHVVVDAHAHVLDHRNGRRIAAGALYRVLNLHATPRHVSRGAPIQRHAVRLRTGEREHPRAERSQIHRRSPSEDFA